MFQIVAFSTTGFNSAVAIDDLKLTGCSGKLLWQRFLGDFKIKKLCQKKVMAKNCQPIIDIISNIQHYHGPYPKFKNMLYDLHYLQLHRTAWRVSSPALPAPAWEQIKFVISLGSVEMERMNGNAVSRYTFDHQFRYPIFILYSTFPW